MSRGNLGQVRLCMLVCKTHESDRAVHGKQVCLKGTLFTPLSEHNTSTQSLNVQLRKSLDLHVNLVHGWTMPGVPTRFSDIDIVVIRCA